MHLDVYSRLKHVTLRDRASDTPINDTQRGEAMQEGVLFSRRVVERTAAKHMHVLSAWTSGEHGIDSVMCTACGGVSKMYLRGSGRPWIIQALEVHCQACEPASSAV